MAIEEKHVDANHDKDEAPPPKKSRKGMAKTRTGCITCKIRRVKCDEAKPNCLRCTSTGRKCDGYIVVIKPKAVSSSLAVPPVDCQLQQESTLTGPRRTSSPMVLPLLRNSFLDFPGSSLEHRYLDFFYNYTSPVLSGYFDAGFWNSLLPRVGRTEPTIQYAMMAVASIHEQVEADSSTLFSKFQKDYTNPHIRLFALQRYNKAISALKQRLTNGCQSQEVTLMCCILFICLEFLRGDIGTAINHLQNGVEILISWRSQLGRSLNANLSDSPTEAHDIESNLSLIFSRLTIQSMLCGRPTSFLAPEVADPAPYQLTPTVFTSLLEARTSMDYLMKVALRFIRVSCDFKYGPDGETKQEMEIQRQAYMRRLEQWYTAFLSFLSVSPFQASSQNRRASTILQILNRIARLWVAVCLQPRESANDECLEGFSTVVALASSLNDEIPISNSSSQSTNPCSTSSNSSSSSTSTTFPNPSTPWSTTSRSGSFAFEMGVIPCLYYVATKCRDRLIRRAAISLLSTTLPRREGLWDANLVGAVAERVMEIEERELTGGLGKMELPSENYRIHDSVIHDSEEGGRGQRITFMSRPGGLDTPWEVRTEEVLWVDSQKVWTSTLRDYNDKPDPSPSRVEVFHVDKNYSVIDVAAFAGPSR